MNHFLVARSNQWEHEIRIEQILPFDPQKTYPICIGGANAAPPEDCGGPERFLALKHHFNAGYIWHRLLEMIDENGSIGDYRAELRTFLYWETMPNQGLLWETSRDQRQKGDFFDRKPSLIRRHGCL